MKSEIENMNTIYTIGHSTHSIDEFITILKSFDINILADIRSLPGSRKYPQFNKENLEISLVENGIEYIYFKDLGGRRKVHKDSHNNRWRNDSFKAYADYMELPEFENAINELQKIARKKKLVYMCAEVLWWRCHRSMVSDYLKAKGWNVIHIMGLGKSQDHRYTSPAIIHDGKVYYSDEKLF